jgi:hypothetical protein
VTTLPRTLVDLAAMLESEGLPRAVHEAEVRHGIRPAQVEAVLERPPRTLAPPSCGRCCAPKRR